MPAKASEKSNSPGWGKALSQTAQGLYKIDIERLAHCLRSSQGIDATLCHRLAEAIDQGALLAGKAKLKIDPILETKLVGQVYPLCYAKCVDPKQPPKTKFTARSDRAVEMTIQMLRSQHNLDITFARVRKRWTQFQG